MAVAIHYALREKQNVACGYFINSYQYRGNILMHSFDMERVTCPQCVEATAVLTEEALVPCTHPDLDRVGDSAGHDFALCARCGDLVVV